MANNNDYRFSIVLNPGDPMHMTAINVLKAKGRRKSQFIVNAVVHYIMSDAAASKTVIPDEETIRSICRDIVDEMLDNSTIPVQNTLIHDKETDTDSTDYEFDFGTIADTLNGFRGKH